MNTTATGLKHDDGKLPMHLVDRTAIEEMAKVLQHGAKKYSAENWRGGIKFTRLIAAAQRHLFAISDGEDVDDESRLYHAAHIMCCMSFLLWMMRHRPELDDRYNSNYRSNGGTAEHMHAELAAAREAARNLNIDATAFAAELDDAARKFAQTTV